MLTLCLEQSIPPLPPPLYPPLPLSLPPSLLLQHSQRLVLLLDAPNGGNWVNQLRSLPRTEQLDLSMCIQASYSLLEKSDAAGHVQGRHD